MRFALAFPVLALALGFLPLPAPADSTADALVPAPIIEEAGKRFVLMVLDQPDRDLAKGRSKINVLVDTKTGKTWVLKYGVKPNSNEQGYVWSEIPFAIAPGE